MGARIAVLTGATGGIGRAFAERLLEDEGIDELWAVSRTPKKLERLRGDLGGRAVPLAADLSTAEGLRAVERALLAQPERPTVAYLVNNAGAAKMGAWAEFPVDEIERTVALNCTAVAALCRICLPFMGRGSRILNVSSASAFQPTPFLGLYAATKAFELSYSRRRAGGHRRDGVRRVPELGGHRPAPARGERSPRGVPRPRAAR